MINPEGKECQSAGFNEILSGVDNRKDKIKEEFQERMEAANALIEVMDRILPEDGPKNIMPPFEFYPGTVKKEGVTIKRTAGPYPLTGERVLNYEIRRETSQSSRQVFIVSRVDENTTVPLILEAGVDEYGRPIEKFRIALADETEGVKKIVGNL